MSITITTATNAINNIERSQAMNIQSKQADEKEWEPSDISSVEETQSDEKVNASEKTNVAYGAGISHKKNDYDQDYIEVSDKHTDKVVRQIPAEENLKITRAIDAYLENAV